MATQTSTSRTNVAEAIETIIWKRAINPIGYNVPMHEVADIWSLPREGDVLKVPRSDEAAEATLLDKNTIYDLQSVTGEDNTTVYEDTYTIVEYGLYSNILKWANFTTALDVAKLIGNRLISSAARTMNSLSYDALASQAGLQWMRVDGLTATVVEKAFTINSATGLATTGFRCDLTDIDDWWNNGQVVMTGGPNRGLARKLTDFTNANGVVVCAAFPNTPTNGDTGFVCVLGNDIGSGPEDITTTHTMTLPAMYRARERCLRFGAGGLGMDGNQQDVVGVSRKKDGHIRQGMFFCPTKIVHELQVTLAGNTAAQDQAYWQTSEGFKRGVGGVVLNVGGLMVIPINYYKQCAITDGALAVGTGAAHPSIVLFPNAFGCTVLKDNEGGKQGMDLNVKKVRRKDPAYMYHSLRYRGELNIINKYFCPNSLHGTALWSGTALI